MNPVQQFMDMHPELCQEPDWKIQKNWKLCLQIKKK